MGKPYTKIDVDDVLAYVRSQVIASPTDAAEHFDASAASMRRKLDALVFRGDLIRDEFNAAGEKLNFKHWRYADGRA